MSAWLLAILFAALLLAAITAIVYMVPLFKESIISLAAKQKWLIYFVLSYPLLYLVCLIIFGSNVHVPNTKHHIPSAFIFLGGHMLLAALAIAAGIHLEKHHKKHLIFIITNSVAGLAYTTITLVLLQMGWHHS